MKMKSVFAEGELLGLPEIVPGRFIKVQDTDDLSNNSYYINEVTHHLSDSEFKTSFEASGSP